MNTATVSGVTVSQLNNTAVNITWTLIPLPTTAMIRYSVYYTDSMNTGPETNVTFNDSNGVITGLETDTDYNISISLIIIINGTIYEGMRSGAVSILIKGDY